MERQIALAMLLFVLAGTYYDARYRKVPNFITFPMLILAVVLHPYPAGFLVWPVFLTTWKLGHIGGGDAKVLMALSVIFGPVAAMLAMLLGGLVALFKKPAMIGSLAVCIALTGIEIAGII